MAKRPLLQKARRAFGLKPRRASVLKSRLAEYREACEAVQLSHSRAMDLMNDYSVFPITEEVNRDMGHSKSNKKALGALAYQWSFSRETPSYKETLAGMPTAQLKLLIAELTALNAKTAYVEKFEAAVLRYGNPRWLRGRAEKRTYTIARGIETLEVELKRRARKKS